MSNHLDHSGLAVVDLDLAAQQMSALGFNLSPVSLHTVPNPDGTLRSAGTANRCAMLQRGYVEVISVTDPSAHSFSNTEIGGFVERFAGLHLLAIGTPDASEIEERLNSGSQQPVTMRDLHRKIDTKDGPRDAGFRLVMVPQLSGLDITFFFIEHKTSELLWTPASLIHPNGALSLYELVVVTDNLATVRVEFERAFGQSAILGPERVTFELAKSRFIVMSPEAASVHYGNPIPNRGLPHCTGQTIGVAELDKTKAILIANGIPFSHLDGRLTVEPQHACGSFLQFVEEKP